MSKSVECIKCEEWGGWGGKHIEDCKKMHKNVGQMKKV